MKFVEIVTDKYIHTDQIGSIEFKVASYNPMGKPFKYQVVTTLIDGTEFITPMGHEAETRARFDELISQVNS